MMKKHKLFRKRPSCPYCGKEIPYGQLWDFRKSSSCRCSSCKSIFKISYPPSSFRLVLWISAAALVVCILLALLFHGEVPIFLLPVILLVSFGLYFYLPLTMQTKTVQKKRRPGRGASQGKKISRGGERTQGSLRETPPGYERTDRGRTKKSAETVEDEFFSRLK